MGARFDAAADRMDGRAAELQARAAEKEAALAERSPAKVDASAHPRVRGAKFEGARLSERGVTYKGTTVPLPATARVESAGEVRRRITATRLVSTGAVGLFWRKKLDDRELYLTVEGDGASFVLDVDPKKGKKARQFAAAVNSARSS